MAPASFDDLSRFDSRLLSVLGLFVVTLSLDARTIARSCCTRFPDSGVASMWAWIFSTLGASMSDMDIEA